MESPRAKAILEKINNWIRPPRPLPKDCQGVKLKNKNNCLPMFYYVGKV